VKAADFIYHRVSNVAEAVRYLEDYDGGARVLAGGQSLAPMLNMRLWRPAALIDINGLGELAGIEVDGEETHIGALVRHVTVDDSPLVAERLPLLAAMVRFVGDRQVRNRGTIGGSVAMADPAAEMPACILALGATLVVQNSAGKREIPAEDYFLGLYETARAENELLVEIRIPSQKPGNVSVFLELARRHGDFAIAGIAAYGSVSGSTVNDMRLVYFASEDKPTIGANAIAALYGKAWSEETKEAVTTALEGDLDPMANLHGSAAMKMHLQKVLTGRAMDTAIARAGGAA
jgi:CO/xanthine dehydrogenase FAD-binding subunit